jgi:HAD superfamily hydrolase (TIGR01549 family)
MIKAIIFDLDDTLLMTKQSRFAALKYFGKITYNAEISDSQIARLWGMPFEQFMVSLFGHKEKLEEIIAQYKAIIPKFPNSAYPDAKDVLCSLKETYTLGIVSSASSYLVTHDLNDSGLPQDWFAYIQGAEDTVVHKPDPHVFDPMLVNMKLKGIDPTEIIFIGDTLGDYKAAAGAGLRFIGMSGRTATAEDFTKIGVPNVTSLTEFGLLVTKM